MSTPPRDFTNAEYERMFDLLMARMAIQVTQRRQVQAAAQAGAIPAPVLVAPVPVAPIRAKKKQLA